MLKFKPLYLLTVMSMLVFTPSIAQAKSTPTHHVRFCKVKGHKRKCVSTKRPSRVTKIITINNYFPAPAESDNPFYPPIADDPTDTPCVSYKDDCDNGGPASTTGPTGPTGATGPTGPTSATGSTGPTSDDAVIDQNTNNTTTFIEGEDFYVQITLYAEVISGGQVKLSAKVRNDGKSTVDNILFCSDAAAYKTCDKPDNTTDVSEGLNLGGKDADTTVNYAAGSDYKPTALIFVTIDGQQQEVQPPPIDISVNGAKP